MALHYALLWNRGVRQFGNGSVRAPISPQSIFLFSRVVKEQAVKTAVAHSLFLIISSFICWCILSNSVQAVKAIYETIDIAHLMLTRSQAQLGVHRYVSKTGRGKAGGLSSNKVA